MWCLYYHLFPQHGLELPTNIPAYVTVSFGSGPLTYPSCCVFEVTGMPTIMYAALCMREKSCAVMKAFKCSEWCVGVCVRV